MRSLVSLRQLNPAVLTALLIAGLGFILTANASATGGLAIQNPNANKASKTNGAAKAASFGTRVLREGMTGTDVQVLRGIVRSKSLLKGSPFKTNFDRPTTSAVRSFQRKTNMKSSGVVNKVTAKKMIRSLPVSVATWYGPGFWGNRTACGKVLRPQTMGVAHKTLPCGTKVLFGHKGRYVTTTVIDRGPYGAGRTWDLTIAASNAIGMTRAGVAPVRSAVVKLGKR